MENKKPINRSTQGTKQRPNEKSNQKPQVLKRSSEFTFLKNNGRRFRLNSWILMSFHLSESKELRFGMTIPKKVGSAVLRNRLKRWCREYFRTNFSTNSPSLDLNLVFFPQPGEFYKKVTYQEFHSEMDRAVLHLQKVCKKAFEI